MDRDIRELLVALNEQNQENMKTLVVELRKADPEVEEKKRIAAERLKLSKEAMQKAVILDEQVKKCKWGICGHKDLRECLAPRCSHLKPNGIRSKYGQVYSDNFFHTFCLMCQYEYPKEAINPTSVVGGINGDGTAGFGGGWIDGATTA